MCAIFVDILQGGTNSHGVTVDDFNGVATDILSDGVVGAITNTAGVSPATGAFAVNEQGTPDMTVAVTNGNAYVTGTPTSGVSQRLRVQLDASENVTIASNSTGGTRYDWIYIKLDADKMKDPAATANDVATLVASRSTSASTDNGTPPTYGFCIAVVTVANSATSIANASIADKRYKSGLDRVNTSDQTIIGKNSYRATRFVALDVPVQALSTDPANTSWTDLDLSARTSANTYAVSLQVLVKAGATTYYAYLRKNGSSLTGNPTIAGISNPSDYGVSNYVVGCDTDQIIEWSVEHADVTNLLLEVLGYWEYVD